MAAEDDVRQASARFYAALNRMVNGDNSAMGDVWAHTPDVTTMHPIGGREVGWDQVNAAFGQVAQLCSGGNVRLQDQLVRVVGDLAYEMGTESGEATMGGQPIAISSQRVTNIYRRDGGQWKLVHHHTDINPAMIELLNRLQAGG